MRLRSPALSFVAGGCLATLLIGVPATALIATATDSNPSTYDGTTPSLTVHAPEFVIGASLDTTGPTDGEYCAAPLPWNFAIPMRLRWTGSDATSGLQAYDVWGYGGRFDGLAKLVADTTATSFDYLGDNYHGDCGGGSSYNFTHWVVAKDNRGNTASSALTAWDRVRVWEETGGSSILNDEPLIVTRTGTWRTVNCTCFSNGRTLASSVVGASLTYQVTTTTPGQRVAVVMEKAANRGRVNISVDGGTASVVDTYSSSTQHRVIVWQQTLSPGSHTVKLTNAGTSGRPRIDVDGVLLSLQPTGAAPEPGNPIS